MSMTDNTQNKTGPLAGIRAVDFCTFVAGAYTSSLLSDLGADVIKVESLEGDSARRVSPTGQAPDDVYGRGARAPRERGLGAGRGAAAAAARQRPVLRDVCGEGAVDLADLLLELLQPLLRVRREDVERALVRAARALHIVDAASLEQLGDVGRT